MVRKIEVKDEEFYHEGARSLLVSTSEVIETRLDFFDDATLRRCGVNQQPEAIAYYIANGDNIVAYFIVKKRCWQNFKGFEACRSWVWPDFRKKGLIQLLRKTAAGSLCLISDPEGMTVAAYESWIKDTNFDHSFFQLQSYEYADSTEIEENEKFAEGALGGKWQLVLTPKICPHT